jgi:glycosyltransferase involved in cell wall biosynthesis
MNDSPKTTPVKVLAMTRLVPEKGVYYILEAIEPLLQSGMAELQFLGEGPMQPLLEREAENRDIEDSVNFLGTVPHADVPSVLRTADVFVNHAVGIDSWEEYFGAANLEAMACSLPTVVTDCGGIPYVIQNDDVVEVVPQRDIYALRETIKQLVNDPDYRRTLGRAGREYVKDRYSIERIATRYDKMLQQYTDA